MHISCDMQTPSNNMTCDDPHRMASALLNDRAMIYDDEVDNLIAVIKTDQSYMYSVVDTLKHR